MSCETVAGCYFLPGKHRGLESPWGKNLPRLVGTRFLVYTRHGIITHLTSRYNRNRHGLWHQRGTVHTRRNYNIQPCSPLHKKSQTMPFLLSYADSGRTNACLPQGSILAMCKSAKVPENLGDTPMASSQLLPIGIWQEPINTINSKREHIRLTSPTWFSRCGGM
jgi:hypothetical protein